MLKFFRALGGLLLLATGLSAYAQYQVSDTNLHAMIREVEQLAEDGSKYTTNGCQVISSIDIEDNGRATIRSAEKCQDFSSVQFSSFYLKDVVFRVVNTASTRTEPTNLLAISFECGRGACMTKTGRTTGNDVLSGILIRDKPGLAKELPSRINELIRFFKSH